MDDSTFIIFHCGKYERIGMRHRETGTLFLSDLIDVHSCRDPGYGKIQTGLYLLIIRDAMERARVFRKMGHGSLAPEEKAQAEPDGRQMKKRPKTRSVTTLAEKEKVVRVSKYILSLEMTSNTVDLPRVRYATLSIVANKTYATQFAVAISLEA